MDREESLLVLRLEHSQPPLAEQPAETVQKEGEDKPDGEQQVVESSEFRGFRSAITTAVINNTNGLNALGLELMNYCFNG